VVPFAFSPIDYLDERANRSIARQSLYAGEGEASGGVGQPSRAFLRATSRQARNTPWRVSGCVVCVCVLLVERYDMAVMEVRCDISISPPRRLFVGFVRRRQKSVGPSAFVLAGYRVSLALLRGDGWLLAEWWWLRNVIYLPARR